MRIHVSKIGTVRMLFTHISWLAVALTVPLACAQGVVPAAIGQCNFVTGNLTFACIPIYIGYLVSLIFSFVGVICLISIIVGGYQIAIDSATGKDQTAGRNRILWSLVGLAVCIFTVLIINMVIDAVAQ